MIARNVEARIVKLETGRQRPNEMLLVWRQPGASIAPAIAAAKFATGDKVICVEWFGEDPMPKPKWHSERLSNALGSREYGFINQTIDRLIAGGECDPAEPTVLLQYRQRQANELTDNELIHAALGVAT